MALENLAETLSLLRERGRLLEIGEPLSPRHEIAAALSLASAGGRRGATLFTSVEGSGVPVAGNLIYAPEILGWALGVDEGSVNETLAARAGAPLAVSTANEAPVLGCKACGCDLTGVLPVLTHYESDSAPFITTGLVSALDPDTGLPARGIHRMEVRGPMEVGVALLSPPLSHLYAKHRATGSPMGLAVAVGVDPLTFVAFALKAPLSLDKLAIAGGLRRKPVEVVPGPHTGIPVPAQAQFLLEGELDPSDEREDGPMGEVGGYSLAFPSIPTFRVKRIHHRASPIYHALLPTGPEGDYLMSQGTDLFLKAAARGSFPFVLGWHFVPSTFGSSCVVRVGRASSDAVKSLMVACLSAGRLKKIVAVGEDVDPSDPAEVEWSLATRFQPERECTILSGLSGQPIDPSTGAGFTSSKIAMDATGYSPGAGRRRAVISDSAAARAASALGKARVR